MQIVEDTEQQFKTSCNKWNILIECEDTDHHAAYLKTIINVRESKNSVVYTDET